MDFFINSGLFWIQNATVSLSSGDHRGESLIWAEKKHEHEKLSAGLHHEILGLLNVSE
jgi:hypothetical protein